MYSRSILVYSFFMFSKTLNSYNVERNEIFKNNINPSILHKKQSSYKNRIQSSIIDFSKYSGENIGNKFRQLDVIII